MCGNSQVVSILSAEQLGIVTIYGTLEEVDRVPKYCLVGESTGEETLRFTIINA
jgi:hypothetical protein